MGQKPRIRPRETHIFTMRRPGKHPGQIREETVERCCKMGFPYGSATTVQPYLYFELVPEYTSAVLPGSWIVRSLTLESSFSHLRVVVASSSRLDEKKAITRLNGTRAPGQGELFPL